MKTLMEAVSDYRNALIEHKLSLFREQLALKSVKTKMVATNEMETVEPVAWRVHPFDYGVGIEGAYAMTMRPEQVEAWKRKGWNIESLYTAPPTSQESRQVEPVAYVTGYSKGYATVQPIDPCLLMPVGMALYRSPPTINEMETVEPVGEIILQDTKYHGRAMAVKPCGKNGVLPEGTKLYAAPPQRTPLTDEHLTALCRQHWDRQANVLDHIAYARAIERAHGIGGEE